MTSLYFEQLESGDRVSVKPHASPVLHAINYLLGTLDESYLTTLREFGGLQSYPSRSKDPDPVDYSTGSVGIGATAPIWGAVARRYVDAAFGSTGSGSQYSLVGDAELDEGAVWEAILDPSVQELGEIVWIIDMNRQSLDRVVPNIAAGRLESMFSAAGWQVIPVRFGRLLEELFGRPGGSALRRRIVEMPNPEYQRLLRCTAEELRERLPAQQPAIGGTWYENRYPGARVDTPSRGYTHCYGVDFHYPYPFCPQSENENYINWVAERFDVGADFEFDTEVKSVVWDETDRLWEVQAVGPDGPRTWRVNAVLSAVGFLARPNVPAIPGADEFAGEAFHTARWPLGLDVAGKRLAVIGSGCSSYQLFPEIAKLTSHSYLFQRTPSWVYETSGYLAPFPPQVNWLDENFPYYSNFLRFRAGWLFGPEILGKAFDKDPETTERITGQRLAFMRKKFSERPDLLEKMLPANPPMSSRPVLVDIEHSVYDALQTDNATLVTEEIQRVTRDGIITADGVQHPVDVIVYATGFKANDFLWPMEIKGRGGVTTEQLWEKDGARAYLGTLMPGFPNFFMIYGPNSNPTGGLGLPEMEELETRFSLQCIAELILEDKTTVEVTEDAYYRYNLEVDQAEQRKIFSGAPVKNYYTNDFGRSAANCPFDGRQMWD